MSQLRDDRNSRIKGCFHLPWDTLCIIKENGSVVRGGRGVVIFCQWLSLWNNRKRQSSLILGWFWFSFGSVGRGRRYLWILRRSLWKRNVVKMIRCLVERISIMEVQKRCSESIEGLGLNKRNSIKRQSSQSLVKDELINDFEEVVLYSFVCGVNLIMGSYLI